MKIVGIIPARYQSSRFPGKPLIDLKGKSMIQRVYEGVKKSKRLETVIVATDDKRIAEEVRRFKGNVVLTSESHTTGTDRCGEVAQQIDADVIINIQGDEPLVDYRQIDQLCDAFLDDNVQIATLGIRINNETERVNPNRIKIVTDLHNNAMYFSRSPIPNIVNGKVEDIASYDFLRHIGLYAYRKSTLSQLVQLSHTRLERVESLEQLRWLFHGYKIRVITTTIETPNIDVPEDVEKVHHLL